MSEGLFFSPSNSLTSFLVFLAIPGVFFGLTISARGVPSDRNRGQASWPLVSIGAIIMAGSVALGFLALSPFWAGRAAVEEARKAFISDRGVSITDPQMKELDWPFHKPAEDEKFGIAQVEYDGEVVSVFLAWEDGEMRLYQLSGQELPPLD